MITVELARNLLGLRERSRPRVDWDEIEAEYQRRSRDEAVAMAGTMFARWKQAKAAD